MKKKSTSFLNKLKNEYEQLYFIHYSCQDMSDANEGYSPRITSIAVLHMDSEQMSSFSMHLVAEELKITRDDIVKRYDDIEKIMLARFFEFVEKRGENSKWIHWNMRNINFGFEALEHRYRILLEKEPYHIDEKKRINLSGLIINQYGSNYARDPKMLNLMDLNGGRHRDFLTGPEEVTAFKANEFIKMHKSTMSKVYFFKSVFTKMNKKTLRTETNQLRYKVNELYQNPIIQIFGILGVVGTIVSLVVMFFTS